MTDVSALVSLTQRLKDAKVLCVGDLMLDRFVHGDVERISPEAPIPVFRVTRETEMLGGVGNVVRNIDAMGGSPLLVSLVGQDDTAKAVKAQLAAVLRLSANLIEDETRPTTIKTRYLAAGQQMMRADRETTAAMGDSQRAQLIDAVEKAMPHADVVVLSDYGKGVLGNGVAAQLIEIATKAQKPVLVDPKGLDYAVYGGATLITPNRKELHEATGLPTGDDGEVIAAAQKLIDDHGIKAVMATRSQDGMTLVKNDGAISHFPAEAREVFDVSGAGDTVVATLATALATSGSLEQAAQLANVAAGIVVGKVGTAAVYEADLTAGLRHSEISDAETKTVELVSLLEDVDRWRKSGLKVGFTNGCFDLLHPGHVSLLKQAKAACDRLVVGLNSDASVKRLKGEERPIQSEASRATVLSSLSDVDRVVLFSQDTPLELIDAIKPDILVKGADYTVETVVGADVVQAHGGKVVLANLEDGHSTTGTISRMNR